MQLVRLADINTIMSHFNGLSTMASDIVSMICGYIMAEAKITLKQPRKITLVASIVEQLVENIQNGTLQPGDKLPSERQLIEMLRVGRSSVREALQGLVMMGLVEIRPGQGTFVKHNLHTYIPAQVEIHRSIYEAVVNGDSQSAQTAMEAHMDFERELVLKVYPTKADF